MTRLLKFEILRLWWDIISKPIGFFLGILFLYFLYKASFKIDYLRLSVNSASIDVRIIFFLCFTYTMGVVMEVVTNICFDIENGIFQRLALSPWGMANIILARFFASSLFGILSIIFLIIIFYNFEGFSFNISANGVFAIILLIFQTMAMTYLIASVAISLKTLNSAMMASIIIMLPLTLMPSDLIHKKLALFLPISAPLDAIRSGINSEMLVQLALISTAFCFLSVYIFNKTYKRQKNQGKLLQAEK